MYGEAIVAGSMLSLMFDAALLSYFKKDLCASDCSEGSVWPPKFQNICTRTACHCCIHATGLFSVKQKYAGYWVIRTLFLLMFIRLQSNKTLIGKSLLKTLLEIFCICLNLSVTVGAKSAIQTRVMALCHTSCLVSSRNGDVCVNNALKRKKKRSAVTPGENNSVATTLPLLIAPFW